MKQIMTIEQFRASRRDCPDLGAFFKDSTLEGVPGFLYGPTGAETYIEKTGACFVLLLDRDIIKENSLSTLERRLYPWAKAEGYLAVEEAA
jgi:hypothetical protein